MVSLHPQADQLTAAEGALSPALRPQTPRRPRVAVTQSPARRADVTVRRYGPCLGGAGGAVSGALDLSRSRWFSRLPASPVCMCVCVSVEAARQPRRFRVCAPALR